MLQLPTALTPQFKLTDISRAPRQHSKLTVSANPGHTVVVDTGRGQFISIFIKISIFYFRTQDHFVKFSNKISSNASPKAPNGQNGIWSESLTFLFVFPLVSGEQLEPSS